MKNKNVDLDDIKELLEKIDVEFEGDLKGDLILDNDLGIDSQEIVELLCEIEETYNVHIAVGEILRTHNLNDVIDIINSYIPNYEFSRKDEIEINTTFSNMIESIWNLNRWEEKLSHIKKLDVLYDDDENQEFLMTVQTDQTPVKVRSIRRKRNGYIEFFQPEPPKYLKHHAGGWEFIDLGNNKLKIILEHKWNLNHEALPKLYPNCGIDEVEGLIENELVEHAMASLNLWKNIVEVK